MIAKESKLYNRAHPFVVKQTKTEENLQKVAQQKSKRETFFVVVVSPTFDGTPLNTFSVNKTF